MYRVGIDPGKTTGYAIVKNGELQKIGEGLIHQVFAVVLELKDMGDLHVVVEDARQRKWFGTSDYAKAKAQGAGSVKRDCVIWEDFLKDNGISFQMVHPTLTKISPEFFEKLTGIKTLKTKTHMRDAAMLVI